MNYKKLNRVFHGMKERCYNKNHEHYKTYGGKGIKVCDEWIIPFKGWAKFKNWALSNGYKEGLTIDRIDVNKDYSPENCRWITIKEQQYNKNNNHLIKYKDRIQPLGRWCEELGLNYDKTRIRINKLHWTVEKAFETKGNVRLRMVIYKGKAKYLKDWCRELNFDYKLVLQRITKLHWSVEKAFETDVMPLERGAKLITYQGKTQYLAAWCKELGLNYQTIYARLVKYHWSIEKAFNK